MQEGGNDSTQREKRRRSLKITTQKKKDGQPARGKMSQKRNPGVRDERAGGVKRSRKRTRKRLRGPERPEETGVHSHSTSRLTYMLGDEG